MMKAMLARRRQAAHSMLCFSRKGPIMTTEPKPLPKWKIDTMEAAIQDLQRVKVPITASRIHKRTGPSVTLDEIRQYAAHRFADPKE